VNEEEWRRRLLLVVPVVEPLPYTGAAAMTGRTGSRRHGPGGCGDGRAVGRQWHRLSGCGGGRGGGGEEGTGNFGSLTTSK
jgi:hypothetical protein